ncbi:hypothetical protein WMY93_003930 [Mugilogobius chulae]|uniref:AIG1-type G domain-containing protein n=1 Tax=Mugilogobius chulae TaxID=88201 RepID=A0AAW0Q8T8_9GOBI
MPQLQIVLLGGRNSGKSSVGNLLLGKEEFVIKERTCCCRRVGVMGAHWLTVVDTPGWWCDLTPQDTSKLVKRELVTSVTLCNPGPHVFIVVVKASSTFTEQRRKAVEEHVQLLGGDVWDHCFLVLVFNDSWRLTEAEEHVQRAGKALRWLYDKCDRRCHSLVLNSDTQIPKLMLKIQKMVAANGNAVFEMPEVLLKKATEEKRQIEKRAHVRFVKMKKERAMLRENLRPMTDIRIVLLGAKMSGKSSIFHTLLVLFSFGDWLGSTTTEHYIESEGKPLKWLVDRCNNRYHILNNKTKGDGFQRDEKSGAEDERGDGQSRRAEEGEGEAKGNCRANLDNFTPLSELKVVLIGGRKTGKSSCGNTILSRETQTTSKENYVNGKKVTVLDTPGSFCATSDLFKTSSAFLIVVNISSAFKDIHLKAIEDQLEEVGSEIWEKSMVLFSFGDCLGDTTIERHIEAEGCSLQRLVHRCANRYHVLNNKKACTRQVNELMVLIEEMAAKERLIRFENGDGIAGEIQLKQEKLQAVHQMDSKTIQERHLSDDSSASSSSRVTSATNTEVTVLKRRSAQLGNIQDGNNFKSCIVPNCKRLSWTEAGQKFAFNLPAWLFGENTQTNMRLYRETPSNSAIVLFVTHSQSRQEEVSNPVRSLCHPILIDRTLKRLTENGNLQNIIDQWGESDLQELEAFIDVYFEMVWEKTMESCQEESLKTEEEKQEDLLANINQKLSKLDVLEEIKEDLVQLKKAIEELKGK